MPIKDNPKPNLDLPHNRLVGSRIEWDRRGLRPNLFWQAECMGRRPYLSPRYLEKDSLPDEYGAFACSDSHAFENRSYIRFLFCPFVE